MIGVIASWEAVQSLPQNGSECAVEGVLADLPVGLCDRLSSGADELGSGVCEFSWIARIDVEFHQLFDS